MRKQIAFATLTDAEIEQIAESLERETYAAVLSRVCKPRAEGGYGLDISRSTLERLRQKHVRLKKINEHITTGEKLTLAKLDDIEAAETPASDEAHHAIMSATIKLAKSDDNTPHQLLALQRLADFPARAEIRANREQRAEEMHAHKIEMNHFRNHIATEHLALSQKSFNLRETLAHYKTFGGTSSESPILTSRDDITETTAAPADKEPPSFPLPAGDKGQGQGFNAPSTDTNPADQNAHNNPQEKNSSSSSAPSASSAVKSTFNWSPEFLAKSRQHTHDLITGKIKPKFIPPEIPCPDPDPLWDWLIDDYVAPPDVQTSSDENSPGDEANPNQRRQARS